jgi:hypothetical protein
MQIMAGIVFFSGSVRGPSPAFQLNFMVHVWCENESKKR